MKLYLATNNKNKVREFTQLLPGAAILSGADLGEPFDPVETGETFLDNALIKARALYDLISDKDDAIVLSDDSGITCNILGDVPGVYSARYAGEKYPRGNSGSPKLSQRDQNAALISHLNNAIKRASDSNSIKDFPYGPRTAFYTCCVVLLYGRNRFLISQNTWEGTIVDDISKASGENGFGYDPIFFLPELSSTAADISSDKKNALSHRSKALRPLIPILRSLLGAAPL